MRQKKKPSFICLSPEMVNRIEESLTLIADEDLPRRISVIEERLKTLGCIDEMASRLKTVESSVWMSKEILTTSEAAMYLGFKIGYLYKLTSENKIPFYKPNGGCIYFSKQELVDWAKSNPITPVKSNCNLNRI